MITQAEDRGKGETSVAWEDDEEHNVEDGHLDSEQGNRTLVLVRGRH